MKRLLLAGSGFLGGETARLFREAGWDVIALARSSAGPSVLACDITVESALEELRGRIGGVDAILHCASSGRGGAEEYRRIYLLGAQNLLRTFGPAPFLFTSSTSVYAQTDGSWVDEDSPAEPARETGRILRLAEEFVLERGGAVARLAGLYGPGRFVLLDKFLDGRAVIEGDGMRRLNHIHRDDAASALFFLLNHARQGVYNVADDCPLTQFECHEWLSQYFHKPLPPRRPVDRDRKRGWTSKRVSNRKLRRLGWKCAHPSFKEAVPGLAQSNAAG